MGKVLVTAAILAAIVLASPQPQAASQFQSPFCAGFEEGYKMIKGDMVIAPICPLEPITPIGSTPFREGIRAGIRAAQQGR